METAKALVVLSGGQDSTTCLAIAIKEHGEQNVKAITFDYGQRHSREIRAAFEVAALAGIEAPEIISMGPRMLAGTSPLTDKAAPLEQYENYEQMDAIIGNRVEKTFVPMRNAAFLTIAANRAVVHNHHWIYTGVCQADNANYPDCRLRFVNAQERAINEALGFEYDDPTDASFKNRIRIITPLMFLSKAQSIQKLAAISPLALVRLAWSHTAYDGAYPPVGKDHATLLRAQGFLEAGWPDPLVVRAQMEGLMMMPTTPNYTQADGTWTDLVPPMQALITAEKERLTSIWDEARHPKSEVPVNSWPFANGPLGDEA